MSTEKMHQGSRNVSPHKATGHQAQTDNEVLVRLGHEQELPRSFSMFTLAALCSCLMATWEALASVLATALVSGGPPCLLYNYIAAFIFTACITVSLAEIASIYPTAGGQYHWVSAMSPPSKRSLPAFLTGWISIGGQTLFSASAAFAGGLQMQGLIVLNNDSFVSEPWQGVLFYWAILAYSAATNIWGLRVLPHINTAAGTHYYSVFIPLFVTSRSLVLVTFRRFIGVVITLLVMANKNSASFVFTDFENSSGWESDGISWLVGLQSAVFPFLGQPTLAIGTILILYRYDAACHLSEELPNASRNVPLAMMYSVLLNGITGLAYCIVLLFATTSLDSLLQTPTQFPFMEVYLQATQSRAGATVLSAIIPIIAAAASMAGLTSSSRTLWAFARDKATPFHEKLSRVDGKLHIPKNAVLTCVAFQWALGFIYLGSTTAFNAIISMAIIGMYLSYLIPIVYMLLYGRRQSISQISRYMKLPNWLGICLNVASIVWMIVAIIFSTFPILMPVTSTNMNYSIVVMIGWLFFGVVYYLFWGRKKFEAPMSDTSVILTTG
ncbi:unnamed protein product [Clonostachys byssicola]|uniref:Choline transport protein n=1 Tax=Clonostachys byssicola TaxID=160290 RepID=A0A9N9XY30_9HYPO|nr:unnamed protein product [Clonostachys byssicola]